MQQPAPSSVLNDVSNTAGTSKDPITFNALTSDNIASAEALFGITAVPAAADAEKKGDKKDKNKKDNNKKGQENAAPELPLRSLAAKRRGLQELADALEAGAGAGAAKRYRGRGASQTLAAA
jgi:2-keto-4-pentenoate hydratase